MTAAVLLSALVSLAHPVASSPPPKHEVTPSMRDHAAIAGFAAGFVAVSGLVFVIRKYKRRAAIEEAERVIAEEFEKTKKESPW